MPGLENSENVGIALALVLAAGASTGLGAAVVFFPSIVKLASRRVLAGSLGFSAGVMTYVSFVEIFQKAQLSFAETHDAGKAYLYSSLTFFAGVLIMTVSYCVTFLAPPSVDLLGVRMTLLLISLNTFFFFFSFLCFYLPSGFESCGCKITWRS